MSFMPHDMKGNEFMTKDEIALNERIGIDRSTLFDFLIKSIDHKKLKTAALQEGRYASITYDSESPCGIGHLVVKDEQIGRVKVSYQKNNLTGKQQLISTLEMTVSAGTNNNLQNLDTYEYQRRIVEVFSLLESVYGITADHASIRVKKLEINATFFLDESYDKYQKAILLLMMNVPPSRYGAGRGNTVKVATWAEACAEQSKSSIETFLVKNSSVELKIYNKAKHLKDMGLLPEDAPDIMRVEYSINDRRILKNAFKDTLVSCLTDKAIHDLFMKYFKRDLANRFRLWQQENHKRLVELTKKHRARKYICPCCRNSFRATKEINVMCMDCNEQFIIAE